MSVFEAKINASYITGNDINSTAINCEDLTVETFRRRKRECHHWRGLILGSNISSGKSAFGLGCMPFLALA
jgi:hypothetical protein